MFAVAGTTLLNLNGTLTGAPSAPTAFMPIIVAGFGFAVKEERGPSSGPEISSVGSDRSAHHKSGLAECNRRRQAKSQEYGRKGCFMSSLPPSTGHGQRQGCWLLAVRNR